MTRSASRRVQLLAGRRRRRRARDRRRRQAASRPAAQAAAAASAAGAVPRRRRGRLAQRHGHRRHGALRHRPRPRRTSTSSRTASSRTSPSSTGPTSRSRSRCCSTRAPAWSRKLPTAQEAAIGFAKRLRHAGSRRGRRLRQPRRRPAPFTNGAPELEQAIRKTSAGGSTSLYNAVYIALKDLKKVIAKNTEEIRRQAIVVLSDGEDTSSLLPFEEVLDLAKRSETAIYAIGLRVGRRTRLDDQGVQGSRVRPAPVRAGNRRPRVLPDPGLGARRPSTGRSPTSSRASTRSATRRATDAATAPGAASSSAWPVRTSPRGPSSDISRRRPRSS